VVILDTDHISLLDHGNGDAARRVQLRLEGLAAGEAAVTIISFEEQTRGWTAYVAKARSVAHQVEAYARLKRHLQSYCSIPVIEFDAKAATEFQRLRHSRIRLGTMDRKIAAIALARRSSPYP
jgi:tRNA(fMet)-specific endonuclease VapC